MSAQQHVVVRRPADSVAEIVLDRPTALNALDTSLAEQLADAARVIADDTTVRAVLLSSSSERAFCVGADLKERARFGDAEILKQRPVLASAFRAVRDLPVPAVAAVSGYALGGGFELALSCDLIVADDTAIFGLPEVRLGLIPGGGGTQLLVRRIGWSRAADVLFTGRHIDAVEAQRLGFVDRRVPYGAVGEEALRLSTEISHAAPSALRNAKRAMRQGFGRVLDDALEMEDAAWRESAVSADRREGIAAFNEKRTPEWPGA